MSTRHWEGAALCWNSQRQTFYNSACDTIEWNNVGQANGNQYLCYGILPMKFWQNLENGGENACVCSFYSADGVSGWTYQNEWGACNGACQAPYFDCDGSNPIARDSPSSEVSSSTEEASPTSASTESSVTVASASAPTSTPNNNGDNTNGAASEATAVSPNIKALVLVLALILMSC